MVVSKGKVLFSRENFKGCGANREVVPVWVRSDFVEPEAMMVFIKDKYCDSCMFVVVAGGSLLSIFRGEKIMDPPSQIQQEALKIAGIGWGLFILIVLFIILLISCLVMLESKKAS